MPRYLLDTNIISALMRAPQGPVAQRIAQVGEANVTTSVIVTSELRYGAVKKGSPRLSRALESVLNGLVAAPFEPPADSAYANIRTMLDRAGTPISANDMLIAAHALALGCIMVTDNVAKFARVEGLSVENWLR